MWQYEFRMGNRRFQGKPLEVDKSPKGRDNQDIPLKMAKILRRLTSRKTTEGPPELNTDMGETTAQCIELLNRSLDQWMDVADDSTLKDISKRVDSLWFSVLDSSNQVAPQRKFMLSEQLVTGGADVMKRLLYVVCYCDDDMKRKIRDLLRFLETWASNDNLNSSVPRKQYLRAPAKFNALLYRARFECFFIIQEGMDGWSSASLFIDIIRIFAKDHDCLMAILNDDGNNSKGELTRKIGCVWALFERLVAIPRNSAFHIAVELFEIVEILFLSDHTAVKEFITKNFEKFTSTFHKLISANNFFIQAKSLKFVYEILFNREYSDLRVEWMKDPNLIKAICLAIQSGSKPVRKQAALLLNLFVMNPEDTPEIHRFLGRNRNLLIDYCLSRVPFSIYPIEEPEMVFADPAYHLIKRNFGRISPIPGKMTMFHNAFRLHYDQQVILRPDRDKDASLQNESKIPSFRQSLSRTMKLTEKNAEQPREPPVKQDPLRSPLRFGKAPKEK